MKTIILIAVLFISAEVNAQQKKVETITIQTSAECDDCKERIEGKLNYTKGVKFAELDVPTKVLTVKYQTKKISAEAIRNTISEIGYDADEVKANPEKVKALPLCCQPGGMKKGH